MSPILPFVLCSPRPYCPELIASNGMHAGVVLAEEEPRYSGLSSAVRSLTLTRGCKVCTRNRIEKARAAGIGDDVLNALVDAVAAVNAGVSAATAREGFRLADASLAEECDALCSPEVSAGR